MVKGRVIDVAVDIRKNSPSFGKFIAVELNSENKRQLLVPRGFAHGFVVLEDDSIFAYKVDNFYSKECDRGIAFDDPTIGIDWQKLTGENLSLNLSAKDQIQPKLLESQELFDYGVNYYA